MVNPCSRPVRPVRTAGVLNDVPAPDLGDAGQRTHPMRLDRAVGRSVVILVRLCTP